MTHWNAAIILKSFAYYHDASQVGTCVLTPDMFLAKPISNPDIAQLAEDLSTKQTATLAAGIDVVMAELKEHMTSRRSRRNITHTRWSFYLSFPETQNRTSPAPSGFRTAKRNAPACWPRNDRGDFQLYSAAWDMRLEAKQPHVRTST